MLQAYQQQLADGGYDMLRPRSTREHVLEVAAGLAALRGELKQRDLEQQRQQLQQRQQPRDLVDEIYEQDKELEDLLRCADNDAASDGTAAGMEVDASSAGMPGSTAPVAADAAAAAAASGFFMEEQDEEPPPSLAQLTAGLQAKIAALQAELEQERAARDAPAPSNSTGDASQPPPKQQQRAFGPVPDVLLGPYRSLLSTNGSIGRQQQQFSGVSLQAANSTAPLTAPFWSMMGKLQPRSVPVLHPGVYAKGPKGVASVAAVAAAAAAQAVAAATGGDSAAVASAAAQAAAAAALGNQAAAAPEVVVVDDSDESDGAAAGSGSSTRAMPTPGSYKKYGDRQVQELWKWYVSGYDGGSSVLERESAGSTGWRDEQKHGRMRWRQLNLVLQRVVAVQHGSSRILTAPAAAAEVDKERIDLGMSLAQYVKHLESEFAAWLRLLCEAWG
jgi:hypothetical protein